MSARWAALARRRLPDGAAHLLAADQPTHVVPIDETPSATLITEHVFTRDDFR